MGIRYTRSCDFTRPQIKIPKRAIEVHDATQSAHLTLGKVSFGMDVCDADLQPLIDALLDLGFHPSQAQVGHNRREAYLTRSGKPFTTREARTWLRAQKYEVAESGRLTAAQLQLYADAH